MSRGPLLSLTSEYLIYRDTWVMQYHGKATCSEGLCSWPPEYRSVTPRGGRGPRLKNPDIESYKTVGTFCHSNKNWYILFYFHKCE